MGKSQEYYTESRFQEFYRKIVPRPLRHIIGTLRTSAVIDLGGGAKNAVFLAGGMRSGSGWVSNIINYDNSYRYMYEPFTPERTPSCKPFTKTLYLRPENRDPAYLEPAKAILGGTVRNSPEINIFNRRLISSKRLIKEVRANLWLKWLRINFPATPIVLLLRHPCAMVKSRLKRPTEKRQLLFTEFTEESDLIHDHLTPYWAEIEDAKTRSEFVQGIFSWCIQQFVPLQQCAPSEVHVVFYEHFAQRPEEEIGALFAYLGKNFDDRVFDAIKRPSEVTSDYSAIVTGKNVVDSWRDEVTQEELRTAIRILEIFGLNEIYSEDSMPDTRGVSRFLQRHSTSVARVKYEPANQSQERN